MAPRSPLSRLRIAAIASETPSSIGLGEILCDSFPSALEGMDDFFREGDCGL